MANHRDDRNTRQTGVSNRTVNVFGSESLGGTYVLRIHVKKQLRIAFGEFKKRKLIDVLPGEYSYVGSALSEAGATTLARRLVRHASRTGEKPTHSIRDTLLRQFCQIGMGDDKLLPSNGKHLWWNVDHLLDRAGASLVGVYAIRSPVRIEAELGRLLQSDPATTVCERGLGANDIPGNTHLLRVEADEIWWRLLPLRMQSLVTPPRSGNLVEAYLRGRSCLPSLYETGASQRISFAKGTTAREMVIRLSHQLEVPDDDLIKDAKFAMAVNTVISNCGKKAVDAIFFSRFPQTRKGVEGIAGCSDTRLRYRVDGVLEGRFRSIARQNDDTVFDTVNFEEVLSRLRRARGILQKLLTPHERVRDHAVANEVKKLVAMCKQSALALQTLLRARKRFDVPRGLERETVIAAIRRSDIRGKTIGNARLALRFIAKNIWDYEEMQRRGIVANRTERDKSRAELSRIIATAEAIARVGGGATIKGQTASDLISKPLNLLA